jgi:hypothetical protein
MKTPKFPLIDPTPEHLQRARAASGLSQPQAAEYAGLANYQRWAEYERGVRPIDPWRWELFLLKAGAHPKLKLVEA